MPGVETMNLGVAELVGRVVEPLGLGELARAREHSLRDIDADHAAGRGGACRVTSRLPGAATDVEDRLTQADRVGGAKVRVVSTELGVIEVQSDA